MPEQEELFDPVQDEKPQASTPVREEPAPADTTQPAQPRNPDGTFAHKHPANLVADARSIGFTDEEIAGMTLPALYGVIRNHLQQQVAFKEQQARARTLQGEDAQPKPAEPEPDELELDESVQWEPSLVKSNRAAAARLRAQQARIDALEKRLEQSAQVSATERIDAAFEALGEQYAGFVGKGSVVDLAKDSKEFRRRNAILQQAGIDIKNLPPQASLKRAIQQAAEVFYEPSAAKPVEDSPYQGVEAKGKKARVSKEDWDQAALKHPTQRGNANEPDGEDKAIRNLGARLRERDANGAREKEIVDGLLD